MALHQFVEIDGVRHEYNDLRHLSETSCDACGKFTADPVVIQATVTGPGIAPVTMTLYFDSQHFRDSLPMIHHAVSKAQGE